MARRNHTRGNPFRCVPDQMSSSPRHSFDKFNSYSGSCSNGPGFIFAAGPTGCTAFLSPGDPNVSTGHKSEAAKVNTCENHYSFSVGIDDSSFSKPNPGKKLLHVNRTVSGSCKQSRGSSHSRSNHVLHKNSFKSASDCKNSLESAMNNLSMNDKGKDSMAKDDGNVFVFRGKGKENVSASANANFHRRDSLGASTFNGKLSGCNVRDGGYFDGDSSNKGSNHERRNEADYTTKDYKNGFEEDKNGEGIPEFRMGNSFYAKRWPKMGKARYIWRRKQKTPSTKEEIPGKNQSTTNAESPSYSPMQYSPCENAFPRSSGDFLADRKASSEKNSSSGFVFAVGTSDNVHAGKPTAKRRLKRNKIKKTAHGGPSHMNSFVEVQDEEESLSNHAKKSSEKLDVVDACEQWRERGNEALQNGDVLKAEEFYTKGISEAASRKPSESLVACYCDRAAARISLGNVQEAINDCKSATSQDPYCAKANLTAAKCYLVMGEANKAIKHFQKCLEGASEVCLDRRIAIEAANGLHHSQKLAAITESGGGFFESKSPDTAEYGFEAVEEALVTSPFSEDLLALKAWFMLLLSRYDAAVDLCVNTLNSALKNCVKNSETEESSCKIWRWFLMAKCYFFTGSLQKSHSLLEKIRQLEPPHLCFRGFKTDRESISSFASTVRDLISQKSAGNEAFKSGKYLAAAEHYNNALSANVQSLPFAAICFCNRAAAYQALGQIADAIADCSLAIAIDGNYARALSRRSILYEMIRDYEQAAIDQRRYASLVRSSIEQREAQRRLSLLVDSAKNDTSLDLYLILGVKKTDSALEIKKAYRKAALRHHPDKACQYVARCDSNHEAGKWGEILKVVHVDADKLFKMIGHANSVLSDPSQKQQFDADDEKRKRGSGAEKGSPKQASGGRWQHHRNKWAHDNFYY